MARLGLWSELSTKERYLAVLRLVRRQGLTYAAAGKILGCSKNCISGALFRAEGKDKGRDRRKTTPRQDRHKWSETSMTETWAEFRKRKAAERAKEKESRNG